MAEEQKCPHCGKTVPPGTPGGLCPECMVKVGIGSEAGTAAGGTKRLASDPPPPADIAKHFPQLEIIELLGSGGMGAVYKARQREIDRLVALKILPTEAASDPGFAERFNREARALAKLNHPNIVALHDFGRVNGLHYFIMEYMDGLNLRQLEQAGKLSPREALQIIPQICEALQFAHDEGIVHRDIKPENVLLDKKGRVKIADFGLARILGHEPEDFRLTRAREVMGTPHYMAPEQVEKPQSVDHRADIYSLGVVFYEMLTGELPLGKFAPPSSCMRGMQLDVRLDDVVLRALEKEPARRYQHASEVKSDVETIVMQPPAATAGSASALAGAGARPALSRRRMILAAVAATLFVLVVALAWVWKRTQSLAAEATHRALSTPPIESKTPVAAKPQTATGWYYVSGEVRNPSRQLYDSRITLLQAIAAAGDFTNFGDREKVRLTHVDGRSETINCVKALDDPKLDPDVHPGDTIHVPRRFAPVFGATVPAPGNNATGARPGGAPGFDWYLGNTLLSSNTNLAPGANGAFLRRYGLAPSAPPSNSKETPEQAFARRYGLRSLPPSYPGHSNDPAVAVETYPGSNRWGYAALGTNVMPVPFSPTNASFSVVVIGTNPLSYQWNLNSNVSTNSPVPGPEGLVITKLTPLHLKLTLDGVTPVLGSTRYLIGVENEAAANPARRSKRVYYCSLKTDASSSNSNQVFNLREVKGQGDTPTVVLELNDTKEHVSVSVGQPYQRVDGYAADLKYEPEHKTWTSTRVGSVLAFSGDEYGIVAITSSEVMLRQKSNNNVWVVKYDGDAGAGNALPGPAKGSEGLAPKSADRP